MNPEDYVSYPIALALKKAGFDWECDHYWYKAYANSAEMSMRQASAYDFNSDDWDVPHCSAPTLWQAQKWLRDKKGIAINVIAHDGGEYNTERIILPICTMPETGKWHVGVTTPMVDSYESALSAGIASALELIEKKGK